MKSAQNFSPIGGLLGPAIHVATLVGVVIAFAELAVGLGTLLGFRARLAAGGRWHLGGSTEWPGVEPPDVEPADVSVLGERFPVLAEFLAGGDV